MINPLLIDEKKDINLDAANYFINFAYNNLNETFYKNIFKVLPGELIIFKNKSIIKEKFLKFSFFKDRSEKFLKEKVENIIKKQAISDVPISLSLSGGIDSNMLLSNIDKDLNTYTVSYKYNNNRSLDSIFAAKRAKEFNTNHFEIHISDDDFMGSLEVINGLLEEPIGSENMVGNYFLSKKVKEKVLLVGDGGDEIFTGYNKYRSVYLISIINKINFFKFLKPLFNSRNLKRLFLNNSKELHLSFSNQNIMRDKSPFKYYNRLKYDEIFYNHFSGDNLKINLSNIMLADIDTWIQDDVLTRNDKIYMNEGIEVRVPFLDQEMIENFLFFNEFKRINILKKTKPLLRKVFKDKLKNTLDIKKGFTSPFQTWINEEKNMSKIKYFFSKEYYLSELLDYDVIQSKLDNKVKNSFEIFSLLMFQISLKKNNF